MSTYNHVGWVLHVQELNLCFGELDQDAGLAVVDAMASKPALKKLDLNGMPEELTPVIDKGLGLGHAPVTFVHS